MLQCQSRKIVSEGAPEFTSVVVQMRQDFGDEMLAAAEQQ